MEGLAPDHDAQGDIAVIAAALGGQPDGGRHFERAGDGDGLVGMPRRFDRGAGALQEQVVQMVVEARLDNEQFRHRQLPLTGTGRSPTMVRP